MSAGITYFRLFATVAVIAAACCTGCAGAKALGPRYASYDQQTAVAKQMPAAQQTPVAAPARPAVRLASATKSAGCNYG